MVARSPEHAVELLDRAFNAGDLETLLALYEDAAVVITEPGKSARGMEELRSFFASVIGSGSIVNQLKTQVIEADGVALILSRWTLTAKEGNLDANSRTFVATTVFRRQPDGGWLALIDNPIGPLILGPE
jgi:uncharacterized protein (TIGR02246 family)